MAHIRTQIRGAIEAQLQGLETSQNRVFVQRVYNAQRAKLPALFIYTGDEDIFYTTKSGGGLPRRLNRNMIVYIDCIAENVDVAENTCDKMIEEIENALDGYTCDGLARVIELRRIDQIRKSGEGEKPIAGVTIEINVNYQTLSNNAGSAA